MYFEGGTPEACATGIDGADGCGELFGDEAGKLRGAANAVKECGEGAEAARVLIEEESCPTAIADDVHELGQIVCAGEQVATPALAGGLYPCVYSGGIYGAKENACGGDFGDESGEIDEGFHQRGVRNDHDAFVLGCFDKARTVLCANGYGAGEALSREVRRRGGKEKHLHHAAAAEAGDAPMPLRRTLRESMVEVAGSDGPPRGKEEGAVSDEVTEQPGSALRKLCQ